MGCNKKKQFLYEKPKFVVTTPEYAANDFSCTLECCENLFSTQDNKHLFTTFDVLGKSTSAA